MKEHVAYFFFKGRCIICYSHEILKNETKGRYAWLRNYSAWRSRAFTETEASKRAAHAHTLYAFEIDLKNTIWKQLVEDHCTDMGIPDYFKTELLLEAKKWVPPMYQYRAVTQQGQEITCTAEQVYVAVIVQYVNYETTGSPVFCTAEDYEQQYTRIKGSKRTTAIEVFKSSMGHTPTGITEFDLLVEGREKSKPQSLFPDFSFTQKPDYLR